MNDVYVKKNLLLFLLNFLHGHFSACVCVYVCVCVCVCVFARSKQLAKW